MAGEVGFGPTTYGFRDRRSNQLRYSPILIQDTLTYISTLPIELFLTIQKIGFEPTTQNIKF